MFVPRKSSLAGAGGLLGPRIMYAVLLILLYLGLCPGQSMSAQKGNLPPPATKAPLRLLVLNKKTVTIHCQRLPEAKEYQILKKEGSKFRTVAWTSTFTTPDKTGLYNCFYVSGGSWSQPSGLPKLVMIGAYKKPSLSSMNGTVVASGGKVMVQCFSKLKFDRFILIQNDELSTTQNQMSTPRDSGYQAIFLMDHVTCTQAGTYRCYGFFHNDPYVWSDSSDPLKLVVKEVPDGSTPMEPGHPRAQDHMPIIISFSVAVLLLLLLFLLLHHRKAKIEAAKTERPPCAAESMNTQASEAIASQDVTYMQVAFNVPTQGINLTPRQNQTSLYATLALR